MSFTHRDQQLWYKFTQDVQPLKKSSVVPVSMTNFMTHAKPHHHVNHTLDLHGMTLAQAYDAVHNHVQQGHQTHAYVTVITGKSGVMQGELPDWVRNMQGIRMCEPINGGGAFRISFKKTRHKKK